MKGYLSGPYEDRGTLDEVVQMQTGLAYMTGPPGRPLRAGASIIDILGAVFGVVAVLAALRERDRTGKGQRVSSSLFESATFLVGSHIAGSAATGQPMPPMPARKGAWGIYDVFAGEDGTQVFIGVTADRQWARFCDVFGFHDLRADTRLESNASRCAEREWLIPELERRFKRLQLQTILDGCENAKIPHARVGRPDDLATDRHLLASAGLLATALAPMGGGPLVGLPALPLEFGPACARATLTRQPPRVGEHSREILTEAGFSAAELEKLVRAGVITVTDH
jgi:crotonobetainyl-CoA:carnitine CoA-transferase CaiB-like acyl-CoA transferase